MMKHVICLAALLCLLPLGAFALNPQEAKAVQTAEACGAQLLDLAERHPQYRLLLVDLSAAHEQVIQDAAGLNLQSFGSAASLQVALETMSEIYSVLQKNDASFAATVKDLLSFGYYSGYDKKRHTLAELLAQAEDVLAERHDIAIELHRDLMMLNHTQEK